MPQTPVQSLPAGPLPLPLSPVPYCFLCLFLWSRLHPLLSLNSRTVWSFHLDLPLVSAPTALSLAPQCPVGGLSSALQPRTASFSRVDVPSTLG